MIKALLRRRAGDASNVRLTRLSKVKFDQLKSYIGCKAYNKGGKVVGTIRRIIAIDRGKALYAEVYTNGGCKKIRASQVYVSPEEALHTNSTSSSIANEGLARTPPLGNVAVGLDELIYELSLMNNAEIEADMKYARGLIPYKVYVEVKRDIAYRKRHLVEEGLRQIKDILNTSRFSYEDRELVMTLLTYAKIYLFEGDSVSRQG